MLLSSEQLFGVCKHLNTVEALAEGYVPGVLTGLSTVNNNILGRGDTTVICIRNQSIVVLMSLLYCSLFISIYGGACIQSGHTTYVQ